jgi:Ni/Co efflux regulator RcnB
MQKFMTGAMALAILASTGAASAQERQDNPQVRRSWRNPPPSQAPRAPDARAAPQAPQAPQAQRADDGRRGGEDRRSDRGDRARRDEGRRGGDEHRGGDRRDWNNRNDRDHRDWNDSRRWDGRGERHDGRRWDHDDRRRDQPRPRYDRRSYDPVWRSPQRYRGWTYRPPAGFYARSWGYGDVLPRGWWGTDYRIMDWWAYGLPIPPVGYDWVRVGDDALLVDMFSGRVVQVAYNLFW